MNYTCPYKYIHVNKDKQDMKDTLPGLLDRVVLGGVVGLLLGIVRLLLVMDACRLVGRGR